MDSDIAVQIDGVWKQYGIIPAFREHWRKFSHGSCQYDSGCWALRDINLTVRKGETLGIIGRNGAGKSTLLKLLAGITPATRGRVRTIGKVFSMIELNAGIHMELTGRENVYLLGAIMGLSRKEIGCLLPSIEEFCELGKYFDQPVRKYSSGMLARLGFSVAVNVRADILLIDEIFAVGDLAFQQKCFRKMEEVVQRGSTILFVTHMMRNVERLCEKAILLEQGRIVEYGSALDIIAAYFRINADKAALELLSRAKGVTPLIHTGTGELRVIDSDIVDSNGQIAETIRYGEPFTIRLYVRAEKPVKSPHLMLIISTPDMINVAAVTTGRGKLVDLPEFNPGEWVIDCNVAPSNLLPGVYLLNAAFDSKDGPKIETVWNIKKFQVVVSAPLQQENNLPGFFWLDCKWSWTNRHANSFYLFSR